MTRSIALIIVTAAVASAIPASAQHIQAPPRADRPYRGLFGGGVADPEELLALTVTAGSGYDDNIIAAGEGAGLVPGLAQGSGFGSGSAQLTYALIRTNVRFNTSISSATRYYGALDDHYMSSHGASIGGDFQLGRSTRLAATHRSTYQPFLTLGLFAPLFEAPGAAAPASPDLAVERTAYYSHTSSVDLTQQLSSRTSISAYYRRQWTDFHLADDRDFRSQDAGIRLSLGFARGLALRAGYGHTDAAYETIDGAAVKGHNIDAGVDYERPLSFSRRTRVGFGTGSAIISDRERTSYRLLSSARLIREIGRTWHAALSFTRAVGYVESLSTPVFADAITVGYGGMVTRRLQLTSNLSASIGEFALTGSRNGFDTYTGSIAATYGLTRHLGLTTAYSYYRYRFDEGAPRPGGFARESDRHSIQAMVNVWMPLVYRPRRADAAR